MNSVKFENALSSLDRLLKTPAPVEYIYDTTLNKVTTEIKYLKQIQVSANMSNIIKAWNFVPMK